MELAEVDKEGGAHDFLPIFLLGLTLRYYIVLGTLRSSRVCLPSSIDFLAADLQSRTKLDRVSRSWVANACSLDYIGAGRIWEIHESKRARASFADAAYARVTFSERRWSNPPPPTLRDYIVEYNLEVMHCFPRADPSEKTLVVLYVLGC